MNANERLRASGPSAWGPQVARAIALGATPEGFVYVALDGAMTESGAAKNYARLAGSAPGRDLFLVMRLGEARVLFQQVGLAGDLHVRALLQRTPPFAVTICRGSVEVSDVTFPEAPRIIIPRGWSN